MAYYVYITTSHWNPKIKGGQPLRIIPEQELTRLFKQAHTVLWAGGQLNPSEAFDELDKLIFCKIWDERKEHQIGEPYDFQVFDYEGEAKSALAKRQAENESLYRRVISLYDEGKEKDPQVFKDNIRLSAEKVRLVVEILQGINLNDTDLDSKGRAFETFLDDFFRGNYGQFFTPRNIVKFMIDVLPITRESRVLDTSCGSGGFLLYALDKVRRQAQELYPNNNPSDKNSVAYKFWHDFASNRLFGIEINEQISRAAKMNMIIHDDGHTNVVSHDALFSADDIVKATGNQGFVYGGFDFVVTNPPFGCTVRCTEPYYSNYSLNILKEGFSKNTVRKSQFSEVMFIELCYKYLKEGGVLSIVLPDGVLTSDKQQYVRDKMLVWFKLIAIISLPQHTFTPNGASVKSSIVIMQKRPISESRHMELVAASILKEVRRDIDYDKKLDDIKKQASASRKETATMKVLAKQKKLREIKRRENDEIHDLNTEVESAYKEKLFRELGDYKIFMSLIESVGYDATGKVVEENELDTIKNDLKNYIESQL